MAKYQVLAVVGGIAKESLNKKFYGAMKELAPKDFELATFDISTLPFFTQDMENDPPEIVQDFKELVKACDAVVFITPEYNRSFPGVLKNALDWPSRPYGQNLWKGKAAAVTGASTGSIGTFGAQHHLRQCLAYLDVDVMGQPELYFNASKAFDENGQIKNDAKKLVTQYWEAFEKHLEHLHIAENKKGNPKVPFQEHRAH
ncbi:NADPH-dependent FMN reductase [Bdellovibrio reynosensis]|uniref:NAD(P)H-dependent oxidoreductase n=1 Tax=Bdellovibrio reynosensis TaxID=2835041 RepID=A0ABY4C9W5_9BACT|nr:NAD(P)H-dependent oxidoreductase [Bdellovibrio reynosensis]UOF01579.1 NAD(P)H-dependent oxidoreductase [Bdellovibrio reynosensis]